MSLTPAQARKIRFARSAFTEHGRIYHTATCECGEQVHAEGRVDSISGVGELNRQISLHRQRHLVWRTRDRI